MWADDATLAVDFEEETTSYSDWTFTNFTTKQTNSGVAAHGGSYFGSTGGKTSGSLVTKEKLAKPKNIQFYISKTSTNSTASSWIIKVSTDGETWTNVKTQSASAVTKGTWTEVTQDLTSYTNVYVGIFYEGTTAIRTIDDVTLTYENVNDTRTATTIALADGYATTGVEGKTVDMPTATVMAGETAVTGAEVTWKSSDESVAKIEGNKISLLSPGTATITATYAGDDSYKSSKATYDLTVTELSVDGLALMAIIFKDSGSDSDSGTKITSIADIISEGNNYVSSIPTADNVYNGRTGRGLKLGSSSKSATLKLTLAKAVKPIKITFDAMQYSAGEASITVNGKTITNLGSELATYSVIYDGETEVSSIEISTPSKRAYITNVKIYYEPEATPAPLYILGDMNSWDRTNPTQMTWDATKNAYTYELNNDATVYFCFADGTQTADEATADNEWSTFNSTYRWSATPAGEENNVVVTLTEGSYQKQLEKGIAKSFELAPGQYVISVTADKVLTITGEATPITPTEAKYYVVGNMTDWNVDKAYEMTRNEGADIDEYSFTMDLTTESQFKVVKVEEGKENVWYPDGMGNNYGENGEITADGTYTIYFRPNYDGGDDWFYNCIYVAVEEVPEPFVFRDIKLDLTVQGFLTDDEYNNKSAVTAKLLVDEEGNISRNDDATEPNVIVTGNTRKDNHGWDNFTMTVPVTGKVKITIGGCEYNSSSKVLTVTPEGGEAFTIAAPAACWHSAKTKNIKSGYFDAGEQTVTLTITGPQYTPYVAIEAVDEIPSIYTVTYAKESDVEGTIPAEVEVTIGEAITLPKNYTLYKEGYTQSGWTDGNTTFELGASYTPEDDVTLTAVFTENEVSLSNREDAVTITYALDGTQGNHNINNSGVVVTQATIGDKIIDVAMNITAGSLVTNNGGWHQVKNNFKATIPSAKGATVVINTYDDPTNLLTFGGSTEFEVSGSNHAWTATYTATADATSLDIAQSGSTYWNKLEITLPKVESTEPGGDDISGVFFSADVIATDKVSFEANTTDQEITSEQATIKGGKLYATNGENSDKVLIGKQGNYYMLCLTNNSTRFKVELDHALAAGDIISAKTFSRTDSKLGLWISTATSRPNTCTAELAIDAVQTAAYEDFSSYTVTADDGLVGAKTIYIYRAVGKSTYFDEFTITRPADEPVAEDVTATWDFVNNCANLAAKAEGGSYTEETMASNVEGISMTIAYNGGQIKNNDNSYQVTNGVVMQIPVKNAGDEVTVVGFPGYYSYSIGGTDATEQTTTHKATADEAAQGYVAVASTSNNNYINSIAVTQYAPKPVGLKEKAIIDTDFQDWAKSSETTMVTTKYTKENITFTYSNATVDPEATNEGKFPTTTDAAYKGYIMSAKSEATITTTTFASISKIRYRHGATGNNRGWGLKMKVGDGEWEIVSDATVGSTPAWIEKTIDKENVQLQWYNLNTTQNAYMFELEVYAKVDLSNSPLLATLKANGTTYTAEDIFEMGTDDNYAATIELASSEAMPSAENPVEAVADNGEIGNITYETSNDQSVVTIPVTAGEASVNYVATFVRKPNFTLTYYNLDGEEIGTQQVEKDAKIGEFAYDIANVAASKEGYKARGWFKNNYVGEKWTTESVITADAKLYAVETEIEVSSDSKRYEFDLTDMNFDAADHEAFNPTGNGKWHDNQHGWAFANGDKLELLVGGKASIILGLCQYSADVKISASNDESVDAKVETDGTTATIEYEGEPGTLTLNFNGTTYLHKLTIFNTTTTNYEQDGDWIIVKEGDGSSLVDALFAAKEGTKIFLPNGTYDLGQKTLTTIGNNNVSIIGESMEGVIIKNRPTTEGIAVTATLLNTSTGLYMQDLTLDCVAPWSGSAERGVTLQDKGNQTILKNVYLKGLQDTYYSNNQNGTYYFEDGKIEGSVDYVCGNGDVYFNKTTFYTVNKSTGAVGGCIAAPNTLNSFGYIFNECTLDGAANEDGKYRLGRPWAANTKCLFVNTTMKIKPVAEGWGDWSPANPVKQFAEYNSKDAEENVISLDGRKTLFNGVENNPVLTQTEAAALAPDVIFDGEWKPQVIAQQVEAPVAELKDGVITWEKVVGATAYALFNNGSLMAIVDGETTSYTIEDAESGQGAPALLRGGEDSSTAYTIRAANGRGGFGVPKGVTLATGIQQISKELGADVKIYDLNGRRVMTPTKGVYIINGKKVVIK